MELVTIRITRGPLTHWRGPAHLENRPGGQ